MSQDMSTDSTTSYTSPSLLRRLAAILYDSILLLALLILFSFPWVIMAKHFEINSKWGLRIIALSLVICFYTYFWLRKQQTLGMTTWRIKLINSQGTSPNTKECLFRLVTALLSIACLGLGYFWVLIDKNQLSWHDHLSSTQLILLPKTKK